MVIHNPKVGGSIPPPATNVFKTYGEPSACRFSFVTLLSREISIAAFSRVSSDRSDCDCFNGSALCIFHRVRVTHRHPNVRPTEDRRQRKSICAGVTHSRRCGMAKIVKTQVCNLRLFHSSYE